MQLKNIWRKFDIAIEVYSTSYPKEFSVKDIFNVDVLSFKLSKRQNVFPQPFSSSFRLDGIEFRLCHCI